MTEEQSKSRVGETKTGESTTSVSEFETSQRGVFVLSQALAVAIESMESVDKAWREDSNINDMKYLFDNLFNMFEIELEDKEYNYIRRYKEKVQAIIEKRREESQDYEHHHKKEK